MNDGKRPWNIATLLISLATGAVVLTGCAGYRLGSMLPPEVKTVFVEVVQNETTEPNIEFDVTQAIISRFQRDGSLKIASRDNADSVLRVTLTEYRLAPAVYEKDRRTAAEEYRVTIVSRILLTRTGTEEVLVEHPRVMGDTVFPLTGDLSSSKRLALPLVATDLAQDIVEKIVDYWG